MRSRLRVASVDKVVERVDRKQRRGVSGIIRFENAPADGHWMTAQQVLGSQEVEKGVKRARRTKEGVQEVLCGGLSYSSIECRSVNRP